MEYFGSNRTNLKLLALGSLAAGAVAGSLWLLRDYRAWIEFGTGGTPPNPRGYIKITIFRILLALSRDNLKDHSSLSPKGQSYLSQLPPRSGPAPKIISRTLPQRQHPEPVDANVRQWLHALPARCVDRHPHLLTLDPSITEGLSTDAIYAKPDAPDRKHGANDRLLGHEIAHVHPAENSLHVWLTEADAKKVLAAGWGERFPLSSLGMVHSGWSFIYAPRTIEEIDVIESIVEAAIANVTGRQI